jgi:hypothetical protein
MYFIYRSDDEEHALLVEGVLLALPRHHHPVPRRRLGLRRTCHPRARP